MNLQLTSILTLLLAAVQAASLPPTSNANEVASGDLFKRQCGGTIINCDGVARCCAGSDLDR